MRFDYKGKSVALGFGVDIGKLVSNATFKDLLNTQERGSLHLIRPIVFVVLRNPGKNTSSNLCVILFTALWRKSQRNYG